MKSILVVVLAVLACLFSLVSWSITAHLLPYLKDLSELHSYDSNWGFGDDGGLGYGIGSSNNSSLGSGSSTSSSNGSGLGSGSSAGSGYESGYGSGYGSGSTYGSGSGSGSGYGLGGSSSGYGSGYGSGSSSGYGSGYGSSSSSGSGSGNSSGKSSGSVSGTGYGYSFASTTTYHPPKAPLAVGAIGLTIAVLVFLFTPVLAFYAWRESRDVGFVPRWLNRTILGLSILGFAIAIAEFGVYGHYKFLLGEPAAAAAMLFLAGIVGIAASVLPLLPASWVQKLNRGKQTGPKGGAMVDESEVKEVKADPGSPPERA